MNQYSPLSGFLNNRVLTVKKWVQSSLSLAVVAAMGGGLMVHPQLSHADMAVSVSGAVGAVATHAVAASDEDWIWASNAANEVTPLLMKMTDYLNNKNAKAIDGLFSEDASITFTHLLSGNKLKRRIYSKDRLVSELSRGVDSFRTGYNDVCYELLIESIDVKAETHKVEVTGKLLGFANGDSVAHAQRRMVRSAASPNGLKQKNALVPKNPTVVYDIRVDMNRLDNGYRLTNFWSYK